MPSWTIRAFALPEGKHHTDPAQTCTHMGLSCQLPVPLINTARRSIALEWGPSLRLDKLHPAATSSLGAISLTILINLHQWPSSHRRSHQRALTLVHVSRAYASMFVCLCVRESACVSLCRYPDVDDGRSDGSGGCRSVSLHARTTID
jgi:hypothetical protein